MKNRFILMFTMLVTFLVGSTMAEGDQEKWTTWGIYDFNIGLSFSDLAEIAQPLVKEQGKAMLQFSKNLLEEMNEIGGNGYGCVFSTNEFWILRDDEQIICQGIPDDYSCGFSTNNIYVRSVFYNLNGCVFYCNSDDNSIDFQLYYFEEGAGVELSDGLEPVYEGWYLSAAINLNTVLKP